MFFFSSRRRHTMLQGDWTAVMFFFFSSRRRHTRLQGDWSSDVCSSDLTPTTGSEYQTFVFDVKADLTGTLKYTDYNLVRNGSPTTVDVGPDFPGTGITAYRSSSTACTDPTKGAEFDGILQVEGETNQYTFTVAACDNGPSGSGLDFFSMSVPNAGYGKSGFLVSGDIVKSSP